MSQCAHHSWKLDVQGFAAMPSNAHAFEHPRGWSPARAVSGSIVWDGLENSDVFDVA